MKCFEITKCSEQDRKNCFVWTKYNTHSQDMENLKCWVIKGVYQEENREQFQRCLKCPYYAKMHQNSGINAKISSDIAVVSCEGCINNDKTRAIDQVWQNLKKNSKYKVLFDISNVTNIYSCGLGELIKIHKEADAKKGILVLMGAQPNVVSILENTKLTRFLHTAPDQDSAVSIFRNLNRKQVEETVAAVTVDKQDQSQPKERIACWEYWKNRNPKNATTCDECYKKASKNSDPCWLVDGIIEGVAFQFTNEECIGCSYYDEYNR